MIRKVLLCSLISVVVLGMLVGCSGSEEDSYAGILMVHGDRYTWQGEIKNNDWTVGEKIGEVEKKVDKEVRPKRDFSSNILEVGEEIYTAVKDTKVIIVKREDGGYDKFTEEGYYNNED